MLTYVVAFTAVYIFDYLEILTCKTFSLVTFLFRGVGAKRKDIQGFSSMGYNSMQPLVRYYIVGEIPETHT